MKHPVTILATIALAACGGKAASPPTTPGEPDHAVHDAAAPAGVAATTEPPASREQPAAPSAASPQDPEAELLAAETAAWQTARPIFDKACASCHTSAGNKASKKKLGHFSFDAYPLGGHHTATIGFTIREVLGLTGDKPTMPYDKPGSVQGDDLATIKAWTDAWEAAERGGAHPAAAGDHHH
jgi:hypothetical protein